MTTPETDNHPVQPTVVLSMDTRFTPQLFAEKQTRRLAELAHVLGPEPLRSFSDDRAGPLLAEADVLLTSWGSDMVTGAVLDRAPRLRAVIHAAGTVKGTVAEECWARGIRVSSAAAANAVPVAEFTLAAIIFANKNVLRLAQRYREERSMRFWRTESRDIGNFGRTIGIVGASRVGRLVMEMLGVLDVDVIVYDPFLGDEEARRLGAERVELDELMERSDVVSLHAPAVESTHHMIGAAQLARMRDGAVLVNTARGWLVHHEALVAELASGRISAVIDTTEPEPLPAESPLYDLTNVLLTPHIAGSIGAETQRMADLALDELARFATGEPFVHEVRLQDLPHIA